MPPAMLLNALIALAMFVLLGLAWGRRPGILVETLAVALIASLVVVATFDKPDQLPITLAIDAAVVAFMARLARLSPSEVSEPARIIMAIGTIKIIFALTGAAVDLNHNARAAARNGAFVVQVIIAGGMADGLIAWLGHRGRSLGDRARRVFHRVEGE